VRTTAGGYYSPSMPRDTAPRTTRELHNELEDLNHDLVAGAQVRLRLAIHHGFASPASNGFAGQGVVVVSRLVDSAPVRQALVVQPGASLAVILSSRVFEDTVVQRHTTLSGKAFRRVVVANKDYTDDAYLYVPGFDVHALDLANVETGPRPEPPPNPEPAGGSGPGTLQPTTVHTEFHGDVHAPNGVFGIAQQAHHG